MIYFVELLMDREIYLSVLLQIFKVRVGFMMGTADAKQ